MCATRERGYSVNTLLMLLMVFVRLMILIDYIELSKSSLVENIKVYLGIFGYQSIKREHSSPGKLVILE